MKMTALDKVAHLIVVIGGLNWGVVGLFDRDVVSEIFGYGSGVARFVFVVVGAAAVYMTYAMVMMMSGKDKKS